MPRAVLARLLALACAAALACGAATANAAETAQVTIEVPQGKLKSVRLRHLPRGAELAVNLSVSGRISVDLVSNRQLKSGHAVALFRATVDRKVSFSLVIPASDDYYLVLDNRHGEVPVRVTATVSAAKGKAKGDGDFDQTRAAHAPRV